MGIVVTYNLRPTGQDKTFTRYAMTAWTGWICHEHQVSFQDGIHELALSLHLQRHRS